MVKIPSHFIALDSDGRESKIKEIATQEVRYMKADAKEKTTHTEEEETREDQGPEVA